MPKKNRLSDITHKKNVNPAIKQKKTSAPENKKLLKHNSIMWLQQAYDNSRGETALWVAVITQALMDALSKCKKSESIYNKHEATCWLTGNSRDFIDVCLRAGLNPDYVRRKAKQALISPIAWRAEAGTGKRYEERKQYRKKQKLKDKELKEDECSHAQIIPLFRSK